MTYTYFALIERGNSNATLPLQASVLELNLSFSAAALSQELKPEIGLRQVLSRQISAYLNESGFIAPKPYAELEALELGPHEEWLPVTVEFEPEQGFFANALPIVGAASYLLSEVVVLIISIVTMELFGKDKLSNTILSKFFSILFALLSNFVSMIIYFYSPSGNFMAALGTKIDSLFKPQQVLVLPNLRLQEPRDCTTSTQLILSKMSLAALASIYVIKNNISLYEQLDAVGDKAELQGTIIPRELFDAATWIQITTTTITSVAFLGGFFKQLADDWEKRIVNKPRPPLRYSLANEPSSAHERASLLVGDQAREEDSDLELATRPLGR